MRKIIKSFFGTPKRKTVFLLIAIVGILLMFGKPAHAYIFLLSDILEAPLRISMGLVVLIFTFALGMVQLFFSVCAFISATFLQWIVTAPVYLTKGGIVDIGWEFCRDIANMFFVIFLLIIAYATILRKESYAMRSLLPTLVLIAFLINFSQVICGIVIDVCNILMNFFIKYGVADVGQMLVKQNPFLKDFLGMNQEEFWNPLSHMFGKPIEEVIKWMLVVMTKAIVALFFTIIEFFLLSVYGLVLLIRIVVVWILVILSPLAFASYVLPATRKTFNEWWDKFLQWALMGVIMLFFLYLAGYLMEHVEVFESCKMNLSESEDANINFAAKIIAEIICDVLPSITAIVMLILGMFIGISAGGGAPGFVQRMVRSPLTPFTGAYSFGKSALQNAALGQLGVLGTKGGTQQSYLQRINNQMLSKGGLGSIFGAPVTQAILNRSKKAREKDLSSLSNDSLETMTNTGSTVDKVSSAKELINRAQKGEISWEKASKAISPELLSLSRQLGVLNSRGLFLKDPTKFASVFGMSIQEALSNYSPKQFNDMLNDNPAAINSDLILGASSKQMDAALKDPSRKTVSRLQDVIQTDLAGLGMDISALHSQANLTMPDGNPVDQTNFKASIKAQLQGNYANRGITLSDSQLNELGEKYFNTIKNKEIVVT